MHDDRQRHGREHLADRDQGGRIQVAERDEQPDEPTGGEQGPGPATGSPRPGDDAGGHVREAEAGQEQDGGRNVGDGGQQCQLRERQSDGGCG